MAVSGPTLLILAAGIGSRYGGFKQIDPLGEAGEVAIDYALYDAWRAGFRKAVFVVRPELEQPLREHFGTRLNGRLETAFVFQDLADLPSGVAVPTGSTKPWGTGHAIRSAREVVREPFAAINADDFYGPEAYRQLAQFLMAAPGGTGSGQDYAMVGFEVRKTLSRHGSVSRGVCSVNPDGFLRQVVERTRIEDVAGRIRYWVDDATTAELQGDEVVSMNMWGFRPSVFAYLEREFELFLAKNGQELKAEFYIPSVVDRLVAAGECRVRVLRTPDTWFGMTYPQDRPEVQARIRELVSDGTYPRSLWG